MNMDGHMQVSFLWYSLYQTHLLTTASNRSIPIPAPTIAANIMMWRETSQPTKENIAFVKKKIIQNIKTHKHPDTCAIWIPAHPLSHTTIAQGFALLICGMSYRLALLE